MYNSISHSQNTKRRSPVSRQRLVVLVAAGIALLAFPAKVKAIDATDIFYGTGAGNATTTGAYLSAFGYNALHNVTTGTFDTAIGTTALEACTTGFYNTAVGGQALVNNTTGIQNTAVGVAPLFASNGNDNTALGFFALVNNTMGNANTATGSRALTDNTTGNNNTATGSKALYSNTTASYNTAAGESALYSNTTGAYNTAHGYHALYSNVSGNFNAALGPSALIANRGNSNAAFGVNSLFHNTTGTGNIAMGFQAGLNVTTGNNNIEIGTFGVAGDNLTTRIGTFQSRAFIAGVRGAVVSGGTAVYVNASGQLGTNPSSKRFKDDIANMDKKSEAVLALRPVTFRYKDQLDPQKTAQFGLIAEEVAKVNPDLVTRDEKGKIYSVRYEAVNAMLLNEFLKEHSKVQQQEQKLDKEEANIARQQTEFESKLAKQQSDFNARLAQQQKQIGELTASLKEQAAQVQKVSAQMMTRQASTDQTVVSRR